MIAPYHVNRLVFLSLTLFILLLVTGCPRSSQQAVVPLDETPVLPHVTAYINVTSGCQEPTVDLLTAARPSYAGVLEIEIVDFGDNAAGADTWKQAGLECMAILFDQVHLAAWDQDSEVKVVDFLMPPGFNWTLEDLQVALDKFASGDLRQPTAEEMGKLQKIEPEPVAAKAQALEQDDGKQIGQLIIAEAVVIEIKQPADDLTPYQRAEAAAEAIQQWTAQPYKPSELRIEKSGESLQIIVRDAAIITITEADAAAAGLPLNELAGKWRLAIRRSLAAANR